MFERLVEGLEQSPHALGDGTPNDRTDDRVERANENFGMFFD